jgi:hypothetical protein
MNRILPTSLVLYGTGGDIKELAFTVISYNKKTEHYELFLTQGADLDSLKSRIETSPFMLAATRMMDEYIESKVNRGFTLVEQTTGNELTAEKSNVLSVYPFLHSGKIQQTFINDEHYWVKAIPRGTYCCIDIDIYKAQCLVTNSSGTPISINKSLARDLKVSIDGFFNESIMLEAIIYEEKIYIVDIISVNGKHTELPFEGRKHWLDNYKTLNKNIEVIKAIKVKSDIDIHNLFIKTDPMTKGIIYKPESLYVCGNSTSVESSAWKISHKMTVNLIVSDINKNMLKLAFMSANKPITCIILPSHGLKVHHLSIVNISVDIIDGHLVFEEVLGLSEAFTNIEDCEDPFELFGLTSPISYTKEKLVDFVASSGFDDRTPC